MIIKRINIPIICKDMVSLFVMRKRFHCEFKKCRCNSFILHCNNRCFVCSHANIWHSKKSKPPTDEYLSFVSSRLSARKPEYTSVSPIQIAVFIPEVPVLPESDDDYIYCECIEQLPI